MIIPRHQARSLPFFLLFALLLYLFQVAVESANLNLLYERSAIFDGELWRMLTGHLVHGHWLHLWLNLGGLMLVWLLFGESAGNRIWLGLTLGLAVGLSAAMLLFDPDMVRYRGLSGVQHGLLAAGAVLIIDRARFWGGLWLLLIFAKIGWEQMFGALPSSREAVGEVAIDAHLIGVLLGVSAAIGITLYRKRVCRAVELEAENEVSR